MINSPKNDIVGNENRSEAQKRKPVPIKMVSMTSANFPDAIKEAKQSMVVKKDARIMESNTANN